MSLESIMVKNEINISTFRPIGEQKDRKQKRQQLMKLAQVFFLPRDVWIVKRASLAFSVGYIKDHEIEATNVYLLQNIVRLNFFYSCK